NLFGAEKISITYAQKTNIVYGQNIHIVGKVERKLTKNNSSFLSMRFPAITFADNQGNILLAIASYLRQRVKSLYEQTLSRIDSALLLGIVFGIRGDFSK